MTPATRRVVADVVAMAMLAAIILVCAGGYTGVIG